MLNVQSLISPFVKNFINIIFFRKKFTIFKVSSINSHSMEPNYHEGSYYLAEKMNDSINLDRYKVVIFFCHKHSTNHIKRIIGLPKEKISIRSGSIYINVPRKLKDDSGKFVISLGEDKDTIDSSMNVKKVVDVVTGSLVLFPASLTHFTIPFESEEERIVLAFDVKQG